MHKLGLSLLFLLFAFTTASPIREAIAGYCPSSKSGKCPTQKKVSHKQSDFTSAQRAKIMEDARNICKKRYGAGSTVYNFDYHKWKVTCNE